MADFNRIDSSLNEESKPRVIKGVPISGQAERLIKVRREVNDTDKMTVLEQIESDARKIADKLTTDGTREAGEILRKANSEAESIREKARLDGKNAARREAIQKVEGLIKGLEAEINELRAVRSDFLGNNLEGIIELSCKLAGKILVSEIRSDPTAIVRRARALLERMPPDIKVKIATSEEDYELLQAYLMDIGGTSEILSTSLVHDPSVRQGCLRLESDGGMINAGVLDTLEELGGILTEQARQLSSRKSDTLEESRG